ncbi:MAG: DNA alkylation repair protein [Chthoniobacterales bacterium]
MDGSRAVLQNMPCTTAKELVVQIENQAALAKSSTVPVLRAIRKRVSGQITGLDRSVIIEGALTLITNGRVHRFVPYELVQYHPATMEKITWPEIEQLADGIASWSEVDSFGCSISGPAWAGERINDSKIKTWARSPNRWLRRAALVSTLALNGQPPAEESTGRTLEICRMLVGDRDDMIVKALSWALRRLGTKDPIAARNFVDQHRAKLASRIVREVNRKLETGRKDGRRRASEK